MNDVREEGPFLDQIKLGKRMLSLLENVAVVCPIVLVGLWGVLGWSVHGHMGGLFWCVPGGLLARSRHVVVFCTHSQTCLTWPPKNAGRHDVAKFILWKIERSLSNWRWNEGLLKMEMHSWVERCIWDRSDQSTLTFSFLLLSKRAYVVVPVSRGPWGWSYLNEEHYWTGIGVLFLSERS